MIALPIGLAGYGRASAALAIAGLAVALSVTRAQRDGARADLQLEKALHETDVANFRATQANANALWQAEVGRLQGNYMRMKDEADRTADRLRSDFAARVMRLPGFPAGADQGGAGAAALPGADFSSSTDGPGGDSVLLARADARICAINTGRLLAGHEFALDPSGR